MSDPIARLMRQILSIVSWCPLIAILILSGCEAELTPEEIAQGECLRAQLESGVQADAALRSCDPELWRMIDSVTLALDEYSDSVMGEIDAMLDSLGISRSSDPPQDAQSGLCGEVGMLSPLEDLIRCAEQGAAEAQFLLGLKYYRGLEVPKDLAAAARLNRLAANQGHVDAQTILGGMYANGEGVLEDDVEAVRWYRLGAEQGNATAQLNLGTMYAGGQGVAVDAVLAYMWWDLATAQGDETARRNIDVIEGMMTREQIAEAQRLSREWIETHPQDGP